MARPDLPEDLEVYIDSLDEQGRVTYISGYFVYRMKRLKFGAIGMEGYGGPNIGATLSDETLTELRQTGLDDVGVDQLITALQRKIMEGQAHIELQPGHADSENEKGENTQSHA
jgi:hypothetical protein